MTRTISFIIGIAVAALVAVPTALGSYGLGDAPGPRATVSPVSTKPDAVTYFYANERATMPFPAAVHDHGSATQAKLLLQSPTMVVVRDNGDAAQAKLTRLSGPAGVLSVRDHGDAEQAMLSSRSPVPSVAAVDSSSGSDIEWSQLAIGFGIGILLATVLWFTLRATRPRSLVH